jgi:outer membrane receptor protein involved in Fe transport
MRHPYIAAVLSCIVALPVVAAETAPPDELETVVVLGSRIRRAQAEGPAPVTVVSAEEMRSGGYADIPAVLASISQNGGDVQSQQSFDAADFSPGGQQVDLRGLGPNHTLVLVNGRRIADFPMPFNGRSNFTDVSNIPLAMVESVEVLSGAASAVYGSDAIAGVVNFKLKKKADRPVIDYRYGWTQDGGGQSHLLSASAGYDNGDFHAVFGGQFLDKKPVWAYDRSIQDSTDDRPFGTYARRNYMRLDIDENYVDPGEATCAALADQNRGSTIYDYRPNWGNYCGTRQGIAYSTIESQRRQLAGIASLTFDLSGDRQLFADLQVSHGKVKLMNDVLDWYYQAPDGNEEGYFYNVNSGVDAYDNWNRIFSPEEMGGLERGMRTVTSTAYSVTPGMRGKLGAQQQWNYEVSFNASEYSQRIRFPLVIAATANALFLGTQQGTDTAYDDYGYPVFDASLTRFYTPLTVAEYDSITANSLYRPRAWLNNLAMQLDTTDLFALPAGPVGFAVIGELGRQGYELRPDPHALEYYYVGWKDSDGSGARNHAALGGEFSVPLLRTLQASLAGRYDTYRFAGHTANKFTYNAGLEFRPVKSLLLRAAYGTAFRAPDLHYVFTGPGNTHPSADDYYLCRTLEPDVDISDCDYSGTGIVDHRSGNRALNPETGDSLTAGFVWAPVEAFDLSADYFRIHMRDQVEDLDIDSVLRTEADCRIGATSAGSPVDINSPTCQDAIARVHRYASGPSAGELESVDVNPVNVAHEATSGIDLNTHLRLPVAIGKLTLGLNYTHVIDHSYQRYPGDSPINKLAFDSDYYIPRDKASASLMFQSGAWTVALHGNYISRLPNYDEDAWVGSYTTWNGSVQYDINERFTVSLAVDNLFDRKPVKDDTWGSYPYYNDSWYDGVGRRGFVQVTTRL